MQIENGKTYIDRLHYEIKYKNDHKVLALLDAYLALNQQLLEATYYRKSKKR